MTTRISAAHLVFILTTLFTAGCSSDDSNGGGSGGTTATGGAGGAAGSGGSAGTTGGSGGSAGATGGSGGVGGGGGSWACVGSVSYPSAPAATLNITKRFYHFSKPHDPADEAPFAGLTVDACDKGSDCATPSDSAVTTAQGDALLTLKTPGIGFEGYLRVHGTDMVTMDMYMLPPIADATSRYLKEDWKPVAWLATAWESFAKSNGVTAIDPAKGHMIVSTMNCDDAFTSEMGVTVNGAGPALTAGGDNVFFNVAPGAVDVAGALAGKQVAHVTGTVVAGRILALHFGPTP